MATTTTKTTKATPIGEDLVNYLFNLYLGRDANAQEFLIYKNHNDDAILRRDLEFAREKELERQKAEAEQKQATATAIPPSDIVFRGDEGLIKFSEDPGPGDTTTVWLVEPSTKTLRPFLSEGAFNNYFEESLAEAAQNGRIQTVPTTWINTEIGRAHV